MRSGPLSINSDPFCVRRDLVEISPRSPDQCSPHQASQSLAGAKESKALSANPGKWSLRRPLGQPITC